MNKFKDTTKQATEEGQQRILESKLISAYGSDGRGRTGKVANIRYEEPQNIFLIGGTKILLDQSYNKYFT